MTFFSLLYHIYINILKLSKDNSYSKSITNFIQPINSILNQQQEIKHKFVNEAGQKMLTSLWTPQEEVWFALIQKLFQLHP